MKKLLITLTVIIGLFSCSPERIDENEPPPAYLGEYLSGSGDTSFVSENGTFAKIEWAAKNHNGRLTFDSVVVHPDLSFTDNEWVTQKIYTPPYSQIVKNVGSGSFGTNSLQFNFNFNGGTISFSGIKSN